MIALPRLYAIADSSRFRQPHHFLAFVEELLAGGCTLLQYRNKSVNPRQVLDQACELKRLVGNSARLIMNDYADLCVAAEFDGVHVGQEDLSASSARLVIGRDRS